MATEPWWQRLPLPTTVHPHLVAMSAFADGRLSADEFVVLYLAAHASEREVLDETTFGILDRVFFAVDSYCADPDLRHRTGGIDGDALVEAVRQALRDLI